MKHVKYKIYTKSLIHMMIYKYISMEFQDFFECICVADTLSMQKQVLNLFKIAILTKIGKVYII